MPGLTAAQRPPAMKLHSHFRLWSWLTPVFGVSDGALLESAGLDALVSAAIAAGLQLLGAAAGCWGRMCLWCFVAVLPVDGGGGGDTFCCWLAGWLLFFVHGERLMPRSCADAPSLCPHP